MDPRVGPDAVKWGKICFLCRESKTGRPAIPTEVSQLVSLKGNYFNDESV
jgi:hypothetical protein